jgi:rubredoxin
MGDEKIISLRAKREEKNPHMTGDARCLVCGHEWVAVAPIGTLWLECPKCTAHMGRFMGPVHRPERAGGQFICGICATCGNDLFYVTPEHIYCPVCGEEVDFRDEC